MMDFNIVVGESIDKYRFHYKAIVDSVYDGDTIHATVDLGMGHHIVGVQKTKVGMRLRLARINAPEVRGDTRTEGLISRDYLQSLIPEGSIILIKTNRDLEGKWDRFLIEIWPVDSKTRTISGTNVNDQMVSSGNAVYKEY